MTTHILIPGQLRLNELRKWIGSNDPIQLAPSAFAAIDESAASIEAVLDRGEIVYGINTGFGSLAHKHIDADQLSELQHRLVVSHAAGTGALLPDTIVRGLMILKVNGLARGYSGIRRSVIDALLTLINAKIYPEIPAKGSVGASGDLAPLAHMSLLLLGLGHARQEGQRISAKDALKRAGLAPIELQAKEGLALLNGTQVSTMLACAGYFAALDLLSTGLVAGALSTDADLGSDIPFDPRIHEIRGQLGQIEVAKILRALMTGSGLRASHIDCDRVQDPYSLRCQPQVMGACLDMIRHAGNILEREANAVSDNPLVFAREKDILSGGNFHAEPVAMAADCLAIALAEIGALSERRIALLTDAKMSNLPAFLVPEPGLNSGFMIAHVTAAALASENKSLAHPASVDSLPTSANQEDHVSMATFAGRRLLEMAENTATILAIELLAAAQGIDLRKPLQTSPLLLKAMENIRAKVLFWKEDRQMAPDIEAIRNLVLQRSFVSLAPLPEAL